jgi:sialate O-acetylesterase
MNHTSGVRCALSSACAFLLFAGPALAEVKLPALLGDGLVLQQQKLVALWGWADPGEEVRVRASWSTAELIGKADAARRWRVELATPAAGGPFEIRVRGKNEIVLRDVLIGEVWLCAGQSNMEMPLGPATGYRGATDWEDELKRADHPTIRLFGVGRAAGTDAPSDDCVGRWAHCDAASARSFSATGYFFARALAENLRVPIGMIESDWGGSPAEDWMSAEALEQWRDLARSPSSGSIAPLPANAPRSSAMSTKLFNGMIAPLTPYGIRGIIWYHGEANRARAQQYRTLFPALIADWRAHFAQGDLPFYFVQIAPCPQDDDTGESAELREAQTRALSVANTGMAVTMDIGDPGDIHPRNKQEVGRRLALCALARTYGKAEIAYSGPLYHAMAIEGDTIRLRFEHAAGLTAHDKALAHFTIAGSDKAFVPAHATIDGETVRVAGEGVKHPVAVRYCWGAADEGTLFNADNLPAPSFRTDDWPGVAQ